jgi:hypothetical protein
VSVGKACRRTFDGKLISVPPLRGRHPIKELAYLLFRARYASNAGFGIHSTSPKTPVDSPPDYYARIKADSDKKIELSESPNPAPFS